MAINDEQKSVDTINHLLYYVEQTQPLIKPRAYIAKFNEFPPEKYDENANVFNGNAECENDNGGQRAIY